MMQQPSIISDNCPANQEVLITNSCGLSARMLNLLFSKEMSDVCLQVGAFTFELHKLILSASSDVFKAMLTNNSWPEAHKQPVVLVEEPLCEAVFARFIEYIYSGELYLSHSTVCPLLTLADKYNVREMIPLCRSYMMNNLDAPISKSCLMQWLKISQLRNDNQMEETIAAFIECNFGKVMQTPDFLAADQQIVETLLSSSRLAVDSEVMVLYAALMWLESFVESDYHSEQEIRMAFSSLLQYIRWDMMTSEEITCLQVCPNIHRFFHFYNKYMCPHQLFTPINSMYCSQSNGKHHLSTTSSTAAQNSNMNQFLSRPEDFIVSEKCYHCMRCVSIDRTLLDATVNKSLTNCSYFNKPSQMSLCLPRVYVSDYWCTALTVANFLAFPDYGNQTFFFSTPTLHSENGGHSLEWEVEMCPKGVHFPPAILIGLEQDGNKLVEESFLNTVRLSVMSRSELEVPLKVEVNVLIKASSKTEPGQVYVERCISKVCIFGSSNQRHNLDNIIPCDRLANYLCSENASMPSLHLTSAMAFTLYIVIRPLPVSEMS